MSKPYVFQLLEEVLRPGHSHLTSASVPTLEGPLQPNNLLDDLFEPLASTETPEPWDVLPQNGFVYVASRNQILRATKGRGTTVCVQFEGHVSCMCEWQDGTLLAGVADLGVGAVGEDGSTETLLTSVDGDPLLCPTAVTVGAGGVIYVADGSRRHAPEDWVWDLMERNRTGRIVSYDPKSGQARVLADGLAYPTGLAITAEPPGLLFTTAWDYRISHLALEGGSARALQQRLPGYPGKLSPAEGAGYWLAVFAMRTALVEFVLTEDRYRGEMMRTIDPDYWIRPSLRDLNNGLEPLQGGAVRKLGIKKPWAPPRSYGLIVRLNSEGEPISSFQSTADRDRHGVMSVRQVGSELYVACYGIDGILVGPSEARPS